MRYLLLVYREEDAPLDFDETMLGCEGLAERLTAEGRYGGGAPLYPTASATSVRVREGRRFVTDGPFAETREALGGYMVVDADDLDHALRIAAEHPVARSGTIEIRPVVDLAAFPRKHMITATRLVAASPEAVWTVLADPDLLPRWMSCEATPMTVDAYDLRVGGRYAFRYALPDGGEMAMSGEYLEVEPPRRIRRTQVCGPGEMTVTSELIPTEGGTEVRVTCEGAPEEAADAIQAGMQTVLGRFAALVEGPTFEIERVFDAPRERVWAAWTEGESLDRWWGPKGWENELLSLNLAPGGTFHYRMSSPMGEMHGTFVYEEIAAPERLVYVSGFADADGARVPPPFQPFPTEMRSVTTLTEVEPGRTRVHLAVRPHGGTPEEVAGFAASFEDMTKGFAGTFERLEEELARPQTFGPPPGEEHAWLLSMVGEWRGEGGHAEGTVERATALGPYFLLLEGKGGMGEYRVILGYDPIRRRYVGTWAGDMMGWLWNYEGQRDAEGRLVLECEGPAFDGSGRLAPYRDVITLHEDGSRTLTSSTPGPDGEWTEFMNARYVRV